MSSSDLEGNDDHEHVTLVRMEDVQPEKTSDIYLDDDSMSACVIENLEYDNECIIDGGDDDYPVGSMVPIKWGEVEDREEETQSDDSNTQKLDCAGDSDTEEYIVPDVMNSSIITFQDTIEDTANKSPSSWPTLEILPGGVIKDADKYNALNTTTKTKTNIEMVYACAKCPQKYKYLFCLVRHVKWHEEQEKKLKAINIPTKSRSLLKPIKKDAQPKKGKMVRIYKLNCDLKNTKIQNFKKTKRKSDLS